MLRTTVGRVLRHDATRLWCGAALLLVLLLTVITDGDPGRTLLLVAAWVAVAVTDALSARAATPAPPAPADRSPPTDADAIGDPVRLVPYAPDLVGAASEN